MIVVALKMIFRTWARNKMYIVISMLSLVIGLTCSVLLIGFVAYEYSIAHSVHESDRWFLLRQQSPFYKNGEVMKNDGGTGSRALELKEYFPEVEDYCVFHEERYGFVVGNRKQYTQQSYAVTVNFPDIFCPEVLGGNVKTALSAPDGMVVTRSFALKHFGKECPVGEEMTYELQRVVNNRTEYYNKMFRILAVIDDRIPGFLQYEQLFGLPDSEISPDTKGWMNTYFTFIKLNKGIVARELERKFQEDEEYRKCYNIFGKQELMPMEEVYFSSSAESDLLKSRDRNTLYLTGSIAFVILLIACFNYINISMTKAVQRLKNINQQMVFGANSREMQIQLIAETALQVFLALGIAVLLIHYILPAFNRFMLSDLTLSSMLTGFSWWVLSLLLLSLIILPSVYIFFRIGRKSVNGMMRDGTIHRPKLVVGMVVIQFAVSVVLLVVLFCMRQQMNYIGHMRPDSEQILSLQFLDGISMDEQKVKDFRQQLIEIPEVEDYTSSAILSNGAVAVRERSAMISIADTRFLSFYGIELLQGQGFDEDSQENEALVNEAFVKAWGLENPVNMELNFNGNYRIVGVVKDFVIDNFTREVQPLLIEFDQRGWESGWATVIKVRPEHRQKAIAKIETLIKKIFNRDLTLIYRTMSEIYGDLHQVENRMLQIVSLFTWVSLFLTGLGLFGLAWYSVEVRTKEIGIRKVNGAGKGEILWLLCRWFIRWINVSLLIGIPISLLLIQQWRMLYVYKPDISLWIFVDTVVIIWVFGLLTVIWQAWKTAIVNPADIIKSE